MAEGRPSRKAAVTMYRTARIGSFALPWRAVEWWGAGIALYLQTGAVGGLGLRVALLPAFAVTAGLLAANFVQIGLVLRRSSLATFLLLALPFLSVAWSTSGSLSLLRAIGLTLSMALAYLLACRFTPRQLLLLVAAVLFPGLAGSLVMLAIAPSAASMPDGTAHGLFLHKNILGWHAAMAVFVGMTLTIDAVASWRIGIVLAVIGVASLVASGSVTALFAVVVAIGLTLFYSAFKRLHGAGRVLLVLLTLQASAAAYVVGWEIVAPSLEALGKDTTLTGRVPMWQLADEAIEQQPLLGYGFQAFWSEGSGAGWKIRARLNWNTPNAHNGFREVLLAFGIAGFLPFMYMIIQALRRAAHLHVSAPDESWRWLNVLLGMVIAMNFTESIFYTPYSSLFIIFMAAVLMVTVREPDFYAKQKPGELGPINVVLPSGSLGAG